MALHYNGVEFGWILTQNHSMKPGKDPSGTDQTGTWISLSVLSLISPTVIPGTANETAEQILARVRHYLTQPRGVMYYDITSPSGSRGAHPIVDLPNGRDDGTGPWPDENALRVSLTSTGLLEVEWTCSVFIRDCGFPFPTEPLSLRWEDSISVDETWKTTYHRSGTCIISSQSAETIEWFRRNKLAPQIPAGFKRVRADYRMSRDGLRCDFNFTDEQIRFAPLYPAVKMTITQSETTPLQGGMKRGQVNVTMVGAQNASVVDLGVNCTYVMMTRALIQSPLGAKQGVILGEMIFQTEEDEHGVRVSASAQYKVQPGNTRNTVLSGTAKNWGGTTQVLSNKNNAGGSGGQTRGLSSKGGEPGFLQGLGQGVSGLGVGNVLGGSLGIVLGGPLGGAVGSLIGGGLTYSSLTPTQVQQQRSQTAIASFGPKTLAQQYPNDPFFNPPAPTRGTDPFFNPGSDWNGVGLQGLLGAITSLGLGGGRSTGGSSSGGSSTPLLTQQQRNMFGFSMYPWIGYGTSVQTPLNPVGFANWANPFGSIGGPEGGVGLATAVRFFAALLNDPCGDQIASNPDAGPAPRELRTTVPAGYNTAAIGGKGAPSPTDVAQLFAAMSTLAAEQYPSSIQSSDNQGLTVWDGEPGVYDHWQTVNEYKDDPGVLVLPTSDPSGKNIKVNYSSAMYTLVRRWAAKRSGAPPKLPPKTVSKASGEVDTNWVYVGGDGPQISNNKVGGDSVSIIYEAKGVYIFQALDASAVTHLADIAPFNDPAPMQNSKSWVQNALDGVLNTASGAAFLNPVGVNSNAAGVAGFFAGVGLGVAGGGTNGSNSPWGNNNLYFPTA